MPQADRLEAAAIWAPLERGKIEPHILERANLSGPGTWNFTAKEDLIRRKQVFLLDFRPRSRNPKFGLFSMGNSLNKIILSRES